MPAAIFGFKMPLGRELEFSQYLEASFGRRGTMVRAYFAGSYVLPNLSQSDCDDITSWLVGLAAHYDFHFAFTASYVGSYRSSSDPIASPGWPPAWALPLPPGGLP